MLDFAFALFYIYSVKTRGRVQDTLNRQVLEKLRLQTFALTSHQLPLGPLRNLLLQTSIF